MHPYHLVDLHKSLYGLKQAPLAWNWTFDQQVKSAGFTPTNTDSCIYMCHHEQNMDIISVYVDNIVVILSAEHLNSVKSMLATTFKMKDMGPISSILGVEVICDRQHMESLSFNREDTSHQSLITST
jgi:hypothetical protein